MHACGRWDGGTWRWVGRCGAGCLVDATGTWAPRARLPTRMHAKSAARGMRAHLVVCALFVCTRLKADAIEDHLSRLTASPLLAPLVTGHTHAVHHPPQLLILTFRSDGVDAQRRGRLDGGRRRERGRSLAAARRFKRADWRLGAC